MARNVDISDQEKKEIDAWERTQNRKHGFELMGIRDRGYQRLSNGVVFIWPTDAKPRMTCPQGNFILSIDNKNYLFNAEEFRRYLRWV